MQVRDLIYLLQSRCKPEDEVVFTTYGKTINGVIQFYGQSNDSLLGVFREGDDGGDIRDDKEAVIVIDDHFIHNIVLSLYKNEITFESTLSPETLEKFKPK